MIPAIPSCPGRKARAHFLAFAALVLAFAGAGPAWSQSTVSTPAGTARQERGAEQAREIIEDLAHAQLAEVESARQALDKTKNAQVRSFAQQMIDEHQKAYEELQQLGRSKQFTVPKETGFQHKAIATALRLLSGDFFDRQYIRQVGINDHRRAVDLLMKLQQTSTDSELKAYAARQLPIVERHLAMARDLDRQMK